MKTIKLRTEGNLVWAYARDARGWFRWNWGWSIEGMSRVFQARGFRVVVEA